MFEDRLNSSLVNSGYQRVDSNTQGIYLFHHADSYNLRIISVIRMINGNELVDEQYVHIINQIKDNFKNYSTNSKKLLSLIITANPEAVRQLATQHAEDEHWIVDIRTNRLMIYETQGKEFSDLNQLIERLLTEEELQRNQTQEGSAGSGYSQGYSGAGSNHQESGSRGYGYQDYDRQGSYYQGTDDHDHSYQSYNSRGRAATNSMYYRYLLTPVTMGIIAMNILVYLFTHYTPFFGGSAVMITSGALSWYDVMEHQEFYRIITSIFLHADWSHLANNMIVLLFIGGNLERIIGRIKFLFIYFATGIIAGITSIGYNMWQEYAEATPYNTTISIGASGAVFGTVGAILFIVLINKGRLREISLGQMVWFVFLSLYNGIANSGIDQAAHVGGFLSGIVLALILYRRSNKQKWKQEI